MLLKSLFLTLSTPLIKVEPQLRNARTGRVVVSITHLCAPRAGVLWGWVREGGVIIHLCTFREACQIAGLSLTPAL